MPNSNKAVRKTKTATITRMLRRERGATLPEIAKTTGWQLHSCRAFLSGLRKSGSALAKEERPGGATAYRIVTEG